MSTVHTQRKELFQRWIEAWCARDLSQADRVADEMVHKDYVMHDPSSPDLGQGPEVWKKFARQVLEENSHVHMTIEDFFGEEDKTATRLMVRTTSASTGKTVSFPVQFITHWVGDQCAEEWQLVGPTEEQP